MPPLISPGAISSIQLGSRTALQPESLIRLVGNLSQGGSAAFTTLRAPGGSAGYQVTAAKTLYLIGIDALVDTGVAASRVGFGYGDNDVGINSTTTPTNTVYPGNSSVFSNLLSTITSGTQITKAMNFQVPATKYPMIACTAHAIGITAQLWGYEA